MSQPTSLASNGGSFSPGKDEMSSKPFHRLELGSLPESPFLVASGVTAGEERFPGTGEEDPSESILSSVYGLKLESPYTADVDDYGDLPFADDGFGCNDLGSFDALPALGTGLEGPLEVSSFVHLIESAPQLSLFAVRPPEDYEQSVERDLLECQRFGKSLHLPSS